MIKLYQRKKWNNKHITEFKWEYEQEIERYNKSLTDLLQASKSVERISGFKDFYCSESYVKRREWHEIELDSLDLPNWLKSNFLFDRKEKEELGITIVFNLDDRNVYSDKGVLQCLN